MKAVLRRSAGLEGLGALDQRALGVLCVGDIDKGEQRAAVGQRQHGARKHAAVGAVEFLLVRHALGDDGGHRRLDALPLFRRVVERAAPVDDSSICGSPSSWRGFSRQMAAKAWL